MLIAVKDRAELPRSMPTFICNASAWLLHGEPRRPFLRVGDTVRLEMKDKAGHSIFGAIERKIAAL